MDCFPLRCPPRYFSRQVIFMHSPTADRANARTLRVDPGHTTADGGGPLGMSWYEPVKSVTDRILAAVLLILTAPLLLLAALAVKLTSRGPIIYSQLRLGRGGQPYKIYKIRSMVQDCEKSSGARWSTPGDPRITPIGQFLRKSHIDELPQLWNVLRGEMSLIGPRPERPEFIPQLEQALPRYRERLLILPGLSGLAQVRLPPDSDLESVRLKLAHDLYYVERLSLWLDVRILLATALNLVGVPPALWLRLLALPGGERVEQAYENRPAQPLPVLPMPHLTPNVQSA
jgi:lipopolysaccharide/colanic/teichoic acid biosynthesis glycosyltransferase